MEREPSNNLLLDQPRLLLQEDSPLGRGIFFWALMALGGLGGWGSFITAFGVPVYRAPLLTVGAVCCVFGVWRQLDTRKRWWSASLLGWAAWLLVLIFRFDSAAHGAVRTLNCMTEYYGVKLNYDLPSFSLPYPPGTYEIDGTGECTVFIALLLFPFFWCMARMWVRRRNNRAPFALTGVLLLLPMSFSILPAWWAFGALLMFWCMLLLMAPSLGGREGTAGLGKKKYRASGVAAARPAALALLLAVGLCMWLVYLYAPMETYERPELAENLRTGLREGFGSSQYLRGGQGNSNKQVQLNALGSRGYTGETMLRVKFDWLEDPPGEAKWYSYTVDGVPVVESLDASGVPPANYYKEYLKSFVGSVYTGESWERLDYEGREEAKVLTAQNLTARYKKEMFSPGRDKRNWYHLSVQNLGANPRCVYIPGSMSSTQEELVESQIELVDDGYAKSADFFGGTREYELDAQARSLGSNYFSRVVGYIAYREYNIPNLSDLGSSLAGNVVTDKYDSENMPGHLSAVTSFGYSPTDIDIKGLFDSINEQGDAAGTGWPADLWVMPEGAVWNTLSTEQQILLRQVEAYNKFVYEYYTRVPEELEDFLVDFRKVYDLDPLGHVDKGDFRYMDGAEYYGERIGQVFRDYFEYTLDPRPVPMGRDFVEFFLGESHEGYCVHFATAAVMLLRSAGYPARYAEGYVVPSHQSGWVDVPDYNAHAWVEVYCGGTGWMPVEVTPAAPDNPAAFYDALMPENPQEYIVTPVPESERPTMPPRRNPLVDEELATPAPRASAAPSPGAGGPGGGGGGSGNTGRVLLAVVWCLCAVMGLGGALVLQRTLRVKKRRRDLSQEDRNAAGLRAYAYLLKLYEKEALCGVRDDPPERWKELAEKARFSAHMLSPEELQELVGDGQRLQEKLRRLLPRGQWVLCWLTGLI